MFDTFDELVRQATIRFGSQMESHCRRLAKSHHHLQLEHEDIKHSVLVQLRHAVQEGRVHDAKHFCGFFMTSATNWIRKQERARRLEGYLKDLRNTGAFPHTTNSLTGSDEVERRELFHKSLSITHSILKISGHNAFADVSKFDHEQDPVRLPALLRRVRKTADDVESRIEADVCASNHSGNLAQHRRANERHRCR